MMTSYENYISRPYFRNHFMNVYCIFSNYFSCFFLNPTHSTRSQHLSITTMKTSKQWEDFYLKKKKKENIATAHDTPHCLSQAPAGGSSASNSCMRSDLKQKDQSVSFAHQRRKAIKYLVFLSPMQLFCSDIEKQYENHKNIYREHSVDIELTCIYLKDGETITNHPSTMMIKSSDTTITNAAVL